MKRRVDWKKAIRRKELAESLDINDIPVHFFIDNKISDLDRKGNSRKTRAFVKRHQSSLIEDRLDAAADAQLSDYLQGGEEE